MSSVFQSRTDLGNFINKYHTSWGVNAADFTDELTDKMLTAVQEFFEKKLDCGAGWVQYPAVLWDDLHVTEVLTTIQLRYFPDKKVWWFMETRRDGEE